MIQNLQERLRRWMMSLPDGPAIQDVNEQVEHLAEELYSEYEPTKGPNPDFWKRLEAWLDNLSEPDQKILFKSLRHLFFIGDRELNNLYRVAFNETVPMWLMDLLGLDLDSPDLDVKLQEALDATWFCPLTDSMRINAFYHLNHISGFNHRPDWTSLATLGSPTQIEAYMSKYRIERIVLLEDFVGSGSQVGHAIEFAAALPSARQVLAIPLVMCPIGTADMEARMRTYANLQVRPVLNLHRFDFVSATPVTDEPALYSELRSVADTAYIEIEKSAPAHQLQGPLGFRDTGGLVVLSTNCPDNTLPFIHFQCATWKALFPRASRL